MKVYLRLLILVGTLLLCLTAPKGHAKMPEDVHERAVDFCFAKLDEAGGNLSALPIHLQTVIIVYSAQGIIDNGGFRYFFESNFPNTPSYQLFSDGYRRIGAEDQANCIDKAVQLFPFDNPHLYEQKRQEYLNNSCEDDDCELIKLGDVVCGDKAVWDKLNIYITNNVSAFAP